MYVNLKEFSSIYTPSYKTLKSKSTLFNFYMILLDGVYFPWQLNFCKLECYTIHNSYDIAYHRSYSQKVQLLYPFSAQCTLAITTQLCTTNTQCLKSLAACIHCDSDPISISISEQQVSISIK